MSDPNTYLDGTGNFNALTKNAGTIKYGTFNNAASNTGVVAVSAIFTGTAVNSGVVGNILPINTANLVASNSAAWDSTYYTVSALSAEWNAGGGGGGSADLTAISDVSATWDAAFTFVSLNSSLLVDTNDARLSDERTPVAHTHDISAVTGLQSALDSKQASGSYATTSITTALSSAIDGKQASGSYASATDARITLVGTTSANWNNSYTTLTANSARWTSSYSTLTATSATWSAKANASHTHAISDVTSLQSTLDAKASSTDARIVLVGTTSANWNTSYTALTANSANWQSAYTTVSGKANTSHTHAIADVTGLQSALDAKASSSHTHTASQVTDFNTAADARIAAAAGVSVASLVGGFVPAAQLPSYVDDVLEYASTASFPATGSTGIIYVATGTNKTYRWSGSAYVEIAASPGSTDSVTEGSTNLYFTNARATAALQTTVNSLSSAIDGKQASGSYAAATDARITLVGTNSANWNSAYTTSNSNSASWSSSYTTTNTNSANWNSSYTVVGANSAAWSAAGSSTPSFSSLTTGGITLSSAMLSTFTAPVTASGDFIVITVGTKKRLIRLWDNT